MPAQRRRKGPKTTTRKQYRWPIEDLPPVNTRRWVIHRKAEVVAAVQGGLISLDDACQRYDLSVEEFLSWQSAINRNGLPGLRVTRVQQYRTPAADQKLDS